MGACRNGGRRARLEAPPVRNGDHSLRELIRRGVAFKVARDSELLGILNEGALAATQVGKFMTIYSAQEAKEINELAEELIAATPEFRGPKVRRTSIWGALCTLATAASARQ